MEKNKWTAPITTLYAHQGAMAIKKAADLLLPYGLEVKEDGTVWGSVSGYSPNDIANLLKSHFVVSVSLTPKHGYTII